MLVYLTSQYESLYQILDNLFVLLNTLAVTVALFYAAKQFNLSKKEKAGRERPFVYFDLEIEHSLCTLVMKNTGGGPAKNIFISFSPDIVLYQNSINELPMFNGLPFFAHNKEIKMFIGSLNGKDNIKKQFTVSLSYSDVYGNKYKEEQLVDPTRYMGLGNINKKGLHEIAKYLEKLSKNSDKSERQLESLVKVFKNGINLRNNNLEKLDIEDLFLLIKNLHKYSDRESLEFYPGLYDAHILLIVTKNKLLLKSRLSKKKKEVIAIINEILNYQYYSGYGREMQEKWKKLVNLL